jgi:hypothetical protein
MIGLDLHTESRHPSLAPFADAFDLLIDLRIFGSDLVGEFTYWSPPGQKSFTASIAAPP